MYVQVERSPRGHVSFNMGETKAKGNFVGLGKQTNLTGVTPGYAISAINNVICQFIFIVSWCIPGPLNPQASGSSSRMGVNHVRRGCDSLLLRPANRAGGARLNKCP